MKRPVVASLLALIALVLPFEIFGAYDKAKEKLVKKRYKEVTYIAHSDCYLVTSKSDRDCFGVCNANGDDVVPAVYKKCSFEKGLNGEVLIFAMRPNYKAPTQGNKVFSLTRGEILNMGSGEPMCIDGGFLSSYGQPIYNMSGNIVLDCQQTAVQPIRHGVKVIAYRVSTRAIVNNEAKDELWLCDEAFNHIFTLDGQGYMWKISEGRDDNGDVVWNCTKDNGNKSLFTVRYSAAGEFLGEVSDGGDGSLMASNSNQTKANPKAAQSTAPKASTPKKTVGGSSNNSAKKSTPSYSPRRASGSSDVDINPPVSTVKAENTFAVIISNENYSEVEDVPYALNDGATMAKYCQATLGIPEKNIRLVQNATLNQMKRQLHWLKQISEAYGSDAKVLFYYSGHGMPDETSKNAYLLPVDGYHSDMTTNLCVNDLYTALSSLKVSQVTVFMDACFSGSQRGDNMLVAARGVKIKAKSDRPKGKMIVMSAAQSNETAYPYEEKNHGMFTYFLLKKLKESGSSVSLGELGDYIVDQVKKTSLIQNDKIQTPSLAVSTEVEGDWRSRSL